MRITSSGSGEPPDGGRRKPTLGLLGADPLNVVVCDDERHIVRLIQVNLERQGHRVRTAFDGRQCLEVVAFETPDLLIVDSHMPYMDGLEVIRILRSKPETTNLRIVLLQKAEDQDSTFDPGGPSGVISKPFNPMHLVALLS